MNREEARLWIKGKADKAEEAIKRYGNLPADADIIPTIEKEIEACRLAEAALRGWVKMADRPPEEKDGVRLPRFAHPVVAYLDDENQEIGFAAFDYITELNARLWFSVPALPEVDA